MAAVEAFLKSYAYTLQAVGHASAFFGLIILIYQIYGTKMSILASTARQRRETTFALYREEREAIRKQHAEIKSALKLAESTIIGEAQMKVIEEDSAIKGEIMSILQKMERFALGIQMDTFDFEVAYQLSRTRIMGMFGVYYDYILHARRKTPAAYRHFETLVDRFEKRTKAEGLPMSRALQKARKRKMELQG